ncbi:MAG: restriction endonuclease subunit S [Clostridiales bacterium]|nr:restriction endonuclease subunit S [Clostridiales bacterium]
MGGLDAAEKPGQGGRPPGKIDASLNEKLASVEWGEYNYRNFFIDIPVKRRLDKSLFCADGKTPVFSSESNNNGILGYTNMEGDYKISENTPIYVVFGDHTRKFHISTESFCVTDNVKVLLPKAGMSVKALLFITTAWEKCIPNRGYSRHWNAAKKVKFSLPTKDGKIDFDLIEYLIAQLEARQIVEMDAQQNAEREAYFSVTGLKNTRLAPEEEQAIKQIPTLKWNSFNLEALFGKSTRGKRLKSADRVAGTLPFVTAGEADEGISDYIGNDVQVFAKNTTTVDMFGSAKYRNYAYGADDHIAVVHTEALPAKAAMFVTAAIHKTSHSGQFSYGRNFYAKDADALSISLPVAADGTPDYETMELLISAAQKLVVQDVIDYNAEKMKAVKTVIRE